MDDDVKYLGVTVLILIAFATIHNVSLDEDDAMSFGYCDTELYCAGFGSPGSCIGVEQRRTDCFDPETAEPYRRVEAECGLLAYNLCDSTTSGREWADDPNATYDGQSCREWAQQDERIDLLACDETFPAVSQWEDIE